MKTERPTGWHVPLDHVLSKLAPLPDGGRLHYALRHGSMRIGLYQPGEIDRQAPHDQDELYIVSAGTASFVKDGDRVACRSQDVLFVEAGADHRFERCSDDFAVWVIFWGPNGGE